MILFAHARAAQRGRPPDLFARNLAQTAIAVVSAGIYQYTT
jgi:hypothetical protein